MAEQRSSRSRATRQAPSEGAASSPSDAPAAGYEAAARDLYTADLREIVGIQVKLSEYPLDDLRRLVAIAESYIVAYQANIRLVEAEIKVREEAETRGKFDRDMALKEAQQDLQERMASLAERQYTDLTGNLSSGPPGRA